MTILEEALRVIACSTTARAELYRWLQEHGCNYNGFPDKPEHEILRLIAETALFLNKKESGFISDEAWSQ